MTEMINISIQGYPGSFHDQAAKKYLGTDVNLVPADTFNILANQLDAGVTSKAVMAIENSIAGSLLQNYRILREHKFWIEGEVYLRIKHNLLINKGTNINEVKEVYSHPMALHQCLKYLNNYPHIHLVESKDTALSAIELAENPSSEKACIASLEAAKLTGLEVYGEGIETNKTNYTRFFVVNKGIRNYDPTNVNKASVYIKIPDKKGQLLKVLACIDRHGLNMSKLQSFPVLGKFREYFFHIDIEFDELNEYLAIRDELKDITVEYTELGIYNRADLTDTIFTENLIENQ